MKKIIKWVRNNLLGFIICAVMFSAIGVVAATLISSSEVSYNNTNSGSSATTVKGALDELYNMAQNCASGTTTGSSTAYYVYGSPYSSRATTDYNNVKDKDGNKSSVFVRYQNNKISLCLIENNKLECFEEGNYSYEKLHMLQVFNGSCTFTKTNSGSSATLTCGLDAPGHIRAEMDFYSGSISLRERVDSSTYHDCFLNVANYNKDNDNKQAYPLCS